MTEWHRFPDEEFKENGYYILRMERDIDIFEYVVAWIDVEYQSAKSNTKFGRGNITHWAKFDSVSDADKPIFLPQDFSTQKRIDWHPFPEEKPEGKYGNYVVTLRDFDDYRHTHDAMWIVDDHYPNGDWVIHDEYCGKIIAWGERVEIEPYDAPIMKEGINLFNSPLD